MGFAGIIEFPYDKLTQAKACYSTINGVAHFSVRPETHSVHKFNNTLSPNTIP